MNQRKRARRARALARFSLRERRPNESDESYGEYMDRKNIECLALERKL